MHTAWRDCHAWRDEGLALSTTNNEAAKMFDATLTQYTSWYEEPSVGGIEASATKMLEEDPDFALGHVLVNGLDVMGTGRSPSLDKEFKKSLDKMAAMKGNPNLSEREVAHVKAMELCGKGYMSEACDIWESVLVEHPTDMLALKFCQDSYFYMGYQPQMRDSIARVFPHWKSSMPLYGYLHGMYSFGLVETNMYEEAEKHARKGLLLDPKDAWSTHSLAHVFEMMGRQDEGIKFMSSTVDDWSVCTMLACHNFWHWAVFHVEKGEYQGAFDIYDSAIIESCKKSGAMLDIVDTTSLLFRLEMEGQNVGERWHDVYEVCRPHIDDHLMCFNDAHILMSCLGDKQKQTTQQMMQSIEQFIRDGAGNQHDIMNTLGRDICRAFVAYDDGDYANAVDLLNPIRYRVLTIGGSNAQRDVFNQFLINAAIKSNNKQHNALARALLVERKALKTNAPLTDRLVGRAMAHHTGTS